MGLLKKLAIVLLLLAVNGVYGQQDQKSKEAAFAASYANETNGDYSKAIQSLKDVYDEESYAVNLRLGWLNYLAGYFTESISYYNTAIKLRPLSIEAKLGITYPAAAVSNWDLVMTQYKEVLKIDENHYTANLKLGQLYLNRKEYKKAEKHFDLLLNQYPFTYDVVLNTAWTYYYLGKLREAKVLFNEVLLLNPGDESATKGLGLIK